MTKTRVIAPFIDDYHEETRGRVRFIIDPCAATIIGQLRSDWPITRLASKKRANQDDASLSLSPTPSIALEGCFAITYYQKLLGFDQSWIAVRAVHHSIPDGGDTAKMDFLHYVYWKQRAVEKTNAGISYWTIFVVLLIFRSLVYSIVFSINLSNAWWRFEINRNVASKIAV